MTSRTGLQGRPGETIYRNAAMSGLVASHIKDDRRVKCSSITSKLTFLRSKVATDMPQYLPRRADATDKGWRQKL
jgi:hypothetical protein